MVIKKRIRFLGYIIAVMVFLLFNNICSYSETKQGEIVSLSQQEELTVLFTFENEVVDISLISPSGVKITSADEGVEYFEGDLWCTFRIENAEKGTWKAEYDLGRNSEIRYSIVETDSGIWIQYLNFSKVQEDKIEFTFEADCNDGDIYYDYEIYAVSNTDSTRECKVAYGSARANAEKTVSASLSNLNSDTYTFMLDVFCSKGEIEVFDSFKSDDVIEYNNPNEPNMIDDFKVKINPDELYCTVDWSDFASGNYSAYILTAVADGEIIYSSEFEKDIKTNQILFSRDAKTLEISLAYKNRDIWSANRTKTIDLSEIVLSNVNGEKSSSAQLQIRYNVKKESILSVSLNDETGEYKIKDEGSLSFNLQSGNNSVYAELETDDLIYYIIDTEVYYDSIPPSITLYDDLDGKSFLVDSVTVLGKISGAQILRIDGEEISVNQDGSFSYEKELVTGENVVTIEAEDTNGNVSLRAITLYKKNELVGGDSQTPFWISVLPFIAAMLTSILIIILSLIFMKKKEKTEGKRSLSGTKFVLWDLFLAAVSGISIWRFVVYYRECNSLHFVDLAEQSVNEAIKYLQLERFFGISSLACLGVLVVSIVITIIVIRANKKNKN